MRNCLRGGRRVGWCTAAGHRHRAALLGSAPRPLGLASLLAASRVGYDLLRFAGAAYLIWLGATSLWPRRRARDGGAGEPRTPWRWWGGAAGSPTA